MDLTSHILLAAVLTMLFYLWLIAPRMFKRPNMTFFKRYHYAHRGFHNTSDAPENSLKSFLYALENGYGIELDVHLTKDGIPVVFHDNTLKRMCNADIALRDLTLTELQGFTLLNSTETIPTLESVLTLINNKVPIIIELKAEKNTTALCEAVNSCMQGYTGAYCIQSFYPSVLGWYKRNRPDIARGQLSSDFKREKKFCSISLAILSCLLTNCYTRPDFISYNCKYPHSVSRLLCRKLFRAPTLAWTVRSVREFIDIKDHFDSYIFENFELSNRIL